MDGMELIEPMNLYNLLNQGAKYPRLSDPNYILLLDCREKEDYNESHIIVSRKTSQDEGGRFRIPYDAELECKQNVVVIDGNTRDLTTNGAGPAVQCAKQLWAMGSRNPVQILKGGYEEFSALYPFLRTQTIIYMPRELDEIKTYPVEIIPGCLFLGNWHQGSSPQVRKDLKLKGYINCCEQENVFDETNSCDLLHISLEDSLESDVYSYFQVACNFIDSHNDKQAAVLVFSKLGISRSATIVIAYAMHHLCLTLQEAYERVKRCCSTIRPNRAFLEQLSRWEENTTGEKSTDTNDPNF